MQHFPAQYGFEAFDMPTFITELEQEEPMVLKAIITEEEYANQWVTIYNLKMGEEHDENGDGLITFDCASSVEENTEEYLYMVNFASNVIKSAIIHALTIEYETTEDTESTIP